MSNPDPVVPDPVSDPAPPPPSIEEDPVVLDFLTPEEYRMLLEAELEAFRAEYDELEESPAQTSGRQQELLNEIARIEALLGRDQATPTEPGIEA